MALALTSLDLKQKPHETKQTPNYGLPNNYHSNIRLFMPFPRMPTATRLVGPVVTEARVALQKGDPNPILKWVNKEHETEVRAAFKETMAIRAKGDDVRAFADRYFFETLVRLHRAGEGEAYTGLKPAGRIEPIVAAADQALVSGAVDPLAKNISAEVSDGISQAFCCRPRKEKRCDQKY